MNTLRNTAYALTFAFITAGSIVGKYIIPICCKKICNVHIGIMSASAESMSNDYDAVLIVTGTV